MHTLRYTISIIILLFNMTLIAQNDKKQTETTENKQKKQIIYKTSYGPRFGIDISKPITYITDQDYKGLEIVGDYRIANKWYVAGELGFENNTFSEEVLKVSSRGKYARLGVNYNMYNNWMDMTNEIYFGTRYGFAKYTQTLNSYIPNVNSEYFPAKELSNSFDMPNLNIHWFEMQLGLKVETIKNLYVGFHGSFKIALSVKEPKQFKAMYAPGFNRIYKSNTGFGFNYTISYMIPLYKK